VWIVNAEAFADHLDFRDRGDYYTFRWRWPRLSWAVANRPLFLDVGEGDLFRVRKLHASVPCGGWGRWVDHFDFIDRALLTAGVELDAWFQALRENEWDPLSLAEFNRWTEVQFGGATLEVNR